MTNGMATAIHLASLVSLVEYSSNFPLPIIQKDAINKPAVMNMTSVEAILNSLMLKLLMEIKIASSVLYSLVCCGHINYQFNILALEQTQITGNEKLCGVRKNDQGRNDW